MAEMNEPNPQRKPQEPPPLYHEAGLLEQFNLPPRTCRYIRAHKTQLWTAFICGVAVALVIAGIDAWHNRTLRNAAAALDSALHASDQRVQLEKVQADYGKTPSALWAEVALARIEEAENRMDEAIKRYTKVLDMAGKEQQLVPLVLGKLADLEERQKNWDAALGHFKKLADIDGHIADGQLGMARIYEAQGKKSESLDMYKKFVGTTGVTRGDEPEDPRRSMVMSHIELMDKPAQAAPAETAAPAPANPEKKAE